MTATALPTPPLYAIASGKGGVGKTSLTLAMATLLAKAGKNVLLVDADTGLANLDVQLNIQPTQDLAHVLSGQTTVESIALPLPQLAPAPTKGSVTLIPGRAGHAGLANAPLPSLTHLIANIRAYATTHGFQVVLFDVAAGISPAQLVFCAEATATLLVATPDPSSLTDAYALVKLLWQQHGTANARLIVNMATAREAESTATRLNTAVEGFLKLPPLPLLGTVPTCKQYLTAVRSHQLAAIAYPNSPAITALEKIITSLT